MSPEENVSWKWVPTSCRDDGRADQEDDPEDKDPPTAPKTPRGQPAQQSTASRRRHRVRRQALDSDRRRASSAATNFPLALLAVARMT